MRISRTIKAYDNEKSRVRRDAEKSWGSVMTSCSSEEVRNLYFFFLRQSISIRAWILGFNLPTVHDFLHESYFLLLHRTETTATPQRSKDHTRPKMNHGARRALMHLTRRYQPQLPISRALRWSSTFDKRQWSTPLARTLADAIKVSNFPSKLRPENFQLLITISRLQGPYLLQHLCARY